MIILDYRDRRPIYEQIVERFQELMISGAMEENSQLPSVRICPSIPTPFREPTRSWSGRDISTR